MNAREPENSRSRSSRRRSEPARSRRWSLQLFLERIERINPIINAYVTVTAVLHWPMQGKRKRKSPSPLPWTASWRSLLDQR